MYENFFLEIYPKGDHDLTWILVLDKRRFLKGRKIIST